MEGTLMETKCGQLKIGAGRAVFEIPESVFPMENYWGIHDNLHARALLLDNGIERVAIVVVELTSISPTLSDQLRKVIGREGDVKFENVLICASHTFTAPHPRIKDIHYDENIIFYHGGLTEKDSVYVEALNRTIIASVRQARERMQPGRLGFSTGQCNVNVNRDTLTAQGWWKCPNFEAPSDKTVSVIKFETLAGKPVALFINYPVQPSVMSDSIPLDGKKKVSSDLGGATARYVEKQYGDEVVALWNIGAAGDQVPLFKSNRYVMDKEGNWSRIDIHDAGYALIELQGERLGYEAVRVSENIRNYKSDVAIRTINKTITCPGQERSKDFTDFGNIVPHKEYKYKKAKPKDLPFYIMIIDDVALIALQVEMNCITSLQIKQASPFKNTVIMTMVNGGAKYAADAVSFDKITYESMNSMYVKGSAEILRDEIINTLNKTEIIKYRK
jgi:Neutral/alkaline non-lysosomal ceramidase, N-terminal